MKLLLSVIVVALLAGAGWFYFEQYEPLVANVAGLTDQNQSLSAANADAKAQIASLNAQIGTLNDAIRDDGIKISQLTSQLNSQQNAPSANVVAAGPKEFVAPFPLPAQPNWTWTVLGRDYHNVVVTNVEPDTVSITYEGGIGTLNTSDLAPDLQKLLNYDPQAAALANQQKAEVQAQADANFRQSLAARSSQNGAALRAEQQKLSQLKSAMDKAQAALMKATTHVNQFGVTVYTNATRDRDGGAERAVSVEVLQTSYDAAKDAYNVELKVIADLQN